MIRGALIAALCAVGVPVWAEGRNDPIMGCAFENGRQIILAENGDDFEWLEGDFTGPTNCSFGATELCTVDHPEWGPQVLVITGGLTPQEIRLGVTPGMAILGGVVFGPKTMVLSNENGLCDRIGR